VQILDNKPVPVKWVEGRITFFDLLFLMFIYLKITHQIDWSWWWVWSPFIYEVVMSALVSTIKGRIW